MPSAFHTRAVLSSRRGDDALAVGAIGRVRDPVRMAEHRASDPAVQRPAREDGPPSRHVGRLDLAQDREHGRGIGLQLAGRGHAGGVARLQGFGLRASRLLVGARCLLLGARGLLVGADRQVRHDERDRAERGE